MSDRPSQAHSTHTPSFNDALKRTLRLICDPFVSKSELRCCSAPCDGVPWCLWRASRTVTAFARECCCQGVGCSLERTALGVEKAMAADVAGFGDVSQRPWQIAFRVSQVRWWCWIPSYNEQRVALSLVSTGVAAFFSTISNHPSRLWTCAVARTNLEIAG